MEFSVDTFNQIKHDAEEFYSQIGSVYCPYFGESVHFNSKGLDHLIFQKWNKTRLIADQYTRFRHLKIAPKIIECSKTLQGMWVTQKFERVKKKDGSWEQLLKLTTYYEFIAIMESHGSKIRIKIVVKQVSGGEKFFLSIIPFWGRDKNNERVMHSGNPEED